MNIATITSKGQITLPRAVREALGVHRGDQVEFVQSKEGEIQIRPLRQHPLRDLYNAFGGPGGPTHSLEQMDEDLADAVADDDRRIQSQT